jgi:hypothetical protein
MIESLSGLGARGRWRARGLWVGRSVAALTRLVGWLAGLVQVIDQWIHHLASVCIYIYTHGKAILSTCSDVVWREQDQPEVQTGGARRWFGCVTLQPGRRDLGPSGINDLHATILGNMTPTYSRRRHSL